MGDKPGESPQSELPSCVTEFIRQVTKKMRYRRKVRQEVEAELIAHFEDELRGGEDPQERERRARRLIEEFGDPKLLGVLCRRAKKRCRPLWRKALVRTAQVFGVFALYLFICSLPMTLGKPTIRVNYVEWLNQRWRPTGVNAANAKPVYDEAVRLYIPPPESVEAKRTNGDAFVRSAVEWFSGYRDEEKAALRRWLEENRPAFDTLRRAARMPYYWPAYDTSGGGVVDEWFVAEAIQAVGGYLEIVVGLRERIAWEASEGRIEEALNDCLVLCRFGRHLQGKGLLNDQLLGVSIESQGHDGIGLILQRSKVPGSVLLAVQGQLEAELNLGRQVVNLDTEKAFWYDRIQRHFTDDGHGGGRALRQGIVYAAGDWRENLIGVLLFDYPSRREAVAMVEDHIERAHKQVAAAPNERDTASPGARGTENLLLGILTPVYGKVGQLAWRLKTHERATITLLAIQRYAGDTGGYPASLEELVGRGYLKDLPADPFGRGPLTYGRTGGGFLLYSWGLDLEDGGGRQGVGQDGQPRMWAQNGDCVFWPIDQE